ncbi:hypothetical protein [Nocardioides limicola]|uniref:hypothetical protein n=1 Tax=Nocardioides limicola TaxID=2803368 RepID=UPI00193C1ED3|nr:hypothetical protein [Nocardioides sp. DJM-14]
MSVRPVGAQHRELLRRVTETASGSASGTASAAAGPSAGLAEEILTADLIGRGSPELDTADQVSERELARVAVSVLVGRLAAVTLPPSPPPPAAPGRLARALSRRRYRLVGDPILADPIRRALVEAGHHPGGRRPTVLVLASSLPTALQHAHLSRVLEAGLPEFASWLDSWAARDRMPPRADPLAAADRWAALVGASRVRLVSDPSLVPELLRIPLRLPDPVTLDPGAAELLRRVGAGLRTRVDPPTRSRLLTELLLPPLAEVAPAAGASVPRRHQAWLDTQAACIGAGLAAAGYPVHGPDPTEHYPTEHYPTESASAAVLTVAVRLLLALDQDSADQTTRGATR